MASNIPIHKLGFGVESCIFYPPFPCQEAYLNTQYVNDNYVQKFSRRPERELKWIPILSAIDPLQKYFVYPLPDKCTPRVSITELKKSCDKIRTDESFIYFMPHVVGNTLQEEFNRPYIDPYNIIFWFIKLLTAIQLLQKHHLMHGDLHPQNILIDASLNPKVIDYGTLKRFDYPTKMDIMQDLFHLSASFTDSITMREVTFQNQNSPLINEFINIMKTIIDTYFKREEDQVITVDDVLQEMYELLFRYKDKQPAENKS